MVVLVPDGDEGEGAASGEGVAASVEKIRSWTEALMESLPMLGIKVTLLLVDVTIEDLEDVLEGGKGGLGGNRGGRVSEDVAWVEIPVMP